MQNPSEDFHEKKKQAKIKLTLRILVTFYILYLTKEIVGASAKNTSSLPLWVTVLASSVFLLASVAFGIYAWREYKNSLAGAASECKPGHPGQGDEDPSGNTRK